MTPQQIFALLRLVADLYMQVSELQTENADLRQELESLRQRYSETKD